MADFLVVPANVKASAGAVLGDGIALVEINIGDAVYEDSAYDGKVGLADSNAALPYCMFAGISLVHVYAGGPVRYVKSDPDFSHGLTLSTGAAVTANLIAILSANAGKLAPSADLAATWKLEVISFILSATKMNLQPSRTGIATP